MEHNPTQSPQKVLITGASKGIGYAIAKQLSTFPSEFQVFGTTRNVASLSEDQKLENVQYFNLDLNDPASIASLGSELTEIDILINNAGCSQNGPVEEVPLSFVRNYFEVNFFGLLALIQTYLPHMRKQRAGYLINISSMAGVSPVPFSSFYAASKAAVNALSYGLEGELHSFGINVVIIAPFDINTDLPQDFRTSSTSEYYPLSSQVKSARDKGLSQAPSPTIIGDLVEQILRTSHPKSFYPVGKNAKLKFYLIKHLPRRTVAKLTRKMFNIP
ncbi:MAG: SDR family oxidoreductase [Promethearchaeota archaeon]|nr:MAG: SDR family oxidoreductase [Candidatus Lokiarchaeota archaeon]